MKREWWKIFGKGAVIGGTMIVPGVSGGTMAMILGIYDRLICSVSSFFEETKLNLQFLVVFSIGALMGLFLLSAPLSWCLKYFEAPTMSFFIGAVIGGIPLIGQKCEIQKITLETVLYFLIGVALVFLISGIPADVSVMNPAGDNQQWLSLMIAGIVSAVALILPGISFSHFLLILGLYDGLLNAVTTMNLRFLVPLAIGVLSGILLFSKLLEMMMKCHPKQTYLIILGFVLGSVAQILPPMKLGGEVLFCMAAALLGALIVTNGSAEMI